MIEYNRLDYDILQLFYILVIFIINLCAILIFSFIVINFIKANKNKTKGYKKSIVETGSMVLFFIFYYLLIRFHFGTIILNNLYLRLFFIMIGLLLIILGTFVNISGRISLGKNWANQIKVYNDQTLVTNGVYSYVRHPLYASLIWIFYGGCLVYLNYASFLANTFIFIPFMYYRAKQEEKLLLKEFKNYKEYINKVGMFFPKIL
jgi:protein-S-isoprenylcysteine O-methyltransferase Ste14